MHLLQLQVEQNINQGTGMLFQYGVLGIFAVLMIYTIWYLEKQRKETEAQLTTRVAKLEQKTDDQDLTIQRQQKEHEEFIKGEFLKASNMVERCVNVLQEVRDLLKSK